MAHVSLIHCLSLIGIMKEQLLSSNAIMTDLVAISTVIRGIEVNEICCAMMFVSLLERFGFQSIEVGTCSLLQIDCLEVLLLSELAESPALLFANNQEQEKHP